jgi:serine/threonine protein kinase
VAALLRDLVDILEHAHRRGVIHRGLRPDRVVITADRRYPLCVPDWSEAIAHDAAVQVPHPMWEGVSHYVAPELAHQLAHGTQEHIDDRVDMFALGVIAYRALTGRLPFDGHPEVLVPAHELRCDAPRDLALMIDSLLAFDRFDRPSAAELRADIDWLFTTLPELQRRAAPDRSLVDGSGPSRAAIEPRVRQPRWTPEVGYRETTDVDVTIFDEREGVGTT